MDIDVLVTRLASQGAKRIYIQAPEGLKTRVQEIASRIEAQGIEVLLGCDPTYGACDLRDKEAKALGCDLLLHIGHTDFGVRPVLPVLYEPYAIPIDLVPLLERHLPGLEGYRTLSLLTTIQFADALEPAARFLERQGKRILFAKQARNQREGLLLGCDWTAALPLEKEVDAYLYLGSGRFHPLGLALKTEKPVLALDVEQGTLTDLGKERDRLLRIKTYHRGIAKDATTFGILLTMKEGQGFVRQAFHLKTALQAMGKQAWILVMDEISPAKIAGMKLDVLVNCACPRMDEDFSLFKKPILNPADVYQLQREAAAADAHVMVEESAAAPRA
ncbi:MAG: diphthamide biosynthesis enzyme Dph2 [Candidatus Aenigmarchaeota archaeon]|nr:diphthamide biosynthesis enzyme Dph2 [Candidatus Aenigmarchaeota archaeon]